MPFSNPKQRNEVRQEQHSLVLLQGVGDKMKICDNRKKRKNRHFFSRLSVFKWPLPPPKSFLVSHSKSRTKEVYIKSSRCVEFFSASRTRAIC